MRMQERSSENRVAAETFGLIEDCGLSFKGSSKRYVQERLIFDRGIDKIF